MVISGVVISGLVTFPLVDVYGLEYFEADYGEFCGFTLFDTVYEITYN